MSDSPYGSTIFSRTSGGLGLPLTSKNINDTLTFGGAGAWIRYQLNWSHIETSTSTSGTPTYNWSCLDSVCDACTAAGVNLLFVLQLAPHGVTDQGSPGLNRLRIDATGADVGYGGSGALYASPADFTIFAQEVAARYNGTTTNSLHGNTQTARTIPAFQLANEEYDTKSLNVNPWQTGGRDDQGKRLGEMLNQAAPAVKAIYPTVKLGINAARRVPVVNYSRTHVIQWLTNVFNTIGSNAQYIDWVDFHYYRSDPTLDGNSPRAQDPSYDVPQTAAGGWPFGADVPSISTELTDMLAVLSSAGYGTSSSHPIQVWCCETGWNIFDDGTRTQDPLSYITPALCSQYYQTAADQMRQNGGSKIMYWTIDSTKQLKTYSPAYNTHDVNGNPVTVTTYSTEQKSIVQIPVAGGSPTYYQPYTDFATYLANYPNWTGGGSGGGGGSSAGPLPGQTLTNGVSNFLFGSNIPTFNPNTSLNTPQIQAQIKAGGFTIMRVYIDPSWSDATIDQAVAGLAAAGCAMLVILDHAQLTRNQHVVTYLGSRCNLYELSNEPDLNGISTTSYQSIWNSHIPTLRAINPHAAYIGPALGVVSNFGSYVIPWLQSAISAGVLPDAVSFHDYPCTGVSSSTTCATKPTTYASTVASLNNQMLTASGVSRTFPLCMTEWNIDASQTRQSYTTDPTFVTPWVHSALDSMASSGLAMANQYFEGDLVHETSPYATNIMYQPMVDKIQQYLGSGSGSGSGGGGGGGSGTNIFYFANAASTTLTTSDTLYTKLGSPTSTWKYSRVGTASGYGEVTSQGTTGAWLAGGSIGSPTGKGFLYDNTSLEGMQIPTGTVASSVRLNCAQNGDTNSNAGTLTADIIVRLYKYNAGTYTQIISMTLAGQTIPSAYTTFTLTGSISSAMNFGTGDKLYIDVWLHVTTNSNGSSVQDVRLNRLSTDTTGNTGDSNASITVPALQSQTGGGGGGGGSGGGSGGGHIGGTNITVATDSFIRSNASGSWGTASNGTDTWTHPLGSSTLAISSNKGTVSAVSGVNHMLLGTGMLINGDFKVRFSVSTTGSLAGIVFRRIDANNYLRVEVGNNILRVRKVVSGTATVLTPNITTNAITNNTNYWIHVNVSGGTNYNVNVWADGTNEPAGYMLSCSDSSITSAGQFGLYANPATNAAIVSLDAFLASTTTNTYFVSPTGSDSNVGSSISPWQTLTKVKTSIQAGDSVFFTNGPYTGNVTLTTAGTASAPISLTSLNPLEATIVEPPGAGLGTMLLGMGADNIILSGFEFTGTDCQYGIVLNNNFLMIENCWVHDVCNSLTLTGSQEGYGIGVPGATFTSIGVVIQSNRVERCGPKDANNQIIANSNVHAIYAMTNSTGTQSAIQNNLIIQSSGYGVALYHNPNNWLVSNNTIINCKAGGIECYGDITNGYIADFDIIQNNIMMECGSSGYYPAIWSQSDNCGFNNKFRSNLAFHPTATAIYDFTTANVNPLQTATNLANANPLFVNYVNDGSGDYHLSTSGSPAVDNGISSLAPLLDFDGKTRPQGIGFDVGCYEALAVMTISIGGIGVLFDEDTFKFSPKVNERWRCQFDVLDYAGNQFFQYGEKVTVTDVNLGTIFTGFVATDQQDKTKVYGSNAIIHHIDCIDNRYKADKRTSNRIYNFPQPAGKIASDMVRDVLKSEGIIAFYASHTDVAETDWSQGTLTNVVTTPDLGGDLELATLSNVSQSITSNADWQAGISTNLAINGGDVLLNETARKWDNGVFSSQKLFGNGHPTQFVDGNGHFNLTCTAQSESRSRFDFAGSWTSGTIQIDVLLDDPGNYHSIVYKTAATSWINNDPSYCYAVELSASLIQLNRGTNASTGPFLTLASQAFNLGFGWYTIRIDFADNSHNVYVNGNHYLSSSDGLYLGAGMIGVRNRNLSNSTSTMKFDNFAVSAALSGTWTSGSAVSLSSISNIVNSLITWDSSSSTGADSTEEVQVSVDGGTTYNKASNGGPLPGLVPGTSGSGKSVKVKATLSTTDLVNSIPHIGAINWTVTSGYTSSGSRTSIPPATYGTDTFTRANAGSWGTASDGQTWFFNQGSGTLAIASNEGTVSGSGTINFMRMGTKIASDINVAVRFSLGASTDYAAIFLRYGSTSDFYRCTFGNTAFYIEKCINGVLSTLVQQNFSQSNGVLYWMRFQVSDNVLSARTWIDGNAEPTIWALNIVDNDLTGGNFGLYANPTSGLPIKFDHLTTINAGVTPGLDLTPVRRVGSTFVGWNANVPTNTTLGVDVSIDGGTTWVDVSNQNGGPLPGITTQPDPTVDNFSADSSFYYAQGAGNGGSGAAWAYDEANDRIIATGGSQAFYTYASILASNIDLFCDMDYSDAGGLVWCYSDANDYYSLVVGDSQSTRSANTLTLYKSQPVSYSTVVQADSPQAYYRLDETSGTTATDASVHGRNATYSGTGVTYSQTGAIIGDTDTAVLLDGVAGVVTCPTSVKPDGYSAFTFEIWVKFAAVPGSSVRIATDATTTTNNKGFSLYYSNTTTSLNFAVGNGTTFGQAVYTLIPSTSIWYHIVGTYDGATITLYVNGSSVATASLTGTIANGTNQITIGCNVGSSGFFHGYIDECATYNTALPYSRVLTHFNYGEGLADRNTTQLAQANINFIRGTYHRIRAKTVDGAITVNFDDAEVLTYTDGSPLASGSAGIFNDGVGLYALRAFGAPVGYGNAQIARFYQLWLQPLGDDVTGITVYTRLRLATTDSSVTPQVETLTIAAFGPQINNGTLIPSADYRYTFISKNLDDLAKQSNYQWWFDPKNVFYFNHRQAQPALWLPQSNSLGLPSDIVLDGNLLVEVAGDLYRNRQVLTGVTHTADFVDIFIGNNNQTSFTLRYKVAPGTIPIITNNLIKQAVGIKGTTGKDWYYAEGDNVIAQDAADIVLTGSNTLVVSYTGTFLDTVVVNNEAAQQALADVEEGTGIVEAVEDVSKPGMLYDAAVTYANQLLARYCITGRTMTFTTYRDGLSVGQVITCYVPEENLYGIAMLIVSMDITFRTQPGNTRLYQYIVTASELAPIGSWAKLLGSGLLD